MMDCVNLARVNERDICFKLFALRFRVVVCFMRDFERVDSIWRIVGWSVSRRWMMELYAWENIVARLVEWKKFIFQFKRVI